MEEKGNQEESNLAAPGTAGETVVVIDGVPDTDPAFVMDEVPYTDPTFVIDGVPDIIADESTIPPSNASSAKSATESNGVPDIIPSNGTISSGDASRAAEMYEPSGLGEWLVGRKVRKWFMGRYYEGKVKMFDKERGWYRILYEDKDCEDLDWQELEEVLVPSDGKVQLKAMAKKIAKKDMRSALKSGKKVACPIKKDNKRKVDHASI
ncbi:hypothetical protein RIF29_40029 [Crotalaria pallida]|uniref:PTM/DIR17-like Tudor domain-containing protein n=1 Tax=Crotalaria pallida TaxID=3830 RepID=A0AAN9E2B9_CROPI